MISTKRISESGTIAFASPTSPASGAFGASQEITHRPIVVRSGPKTALDRQASRLVAWAEARAKERPDLYYGPVLHTPAKLNAAEKAQNKATLALFKKTFDTFLWTGFECSNPLVDRKDRWDQNAIAGLYDPERRAAQLSRLRALGISNARIGLPNHLSDPFAAFDAILKDLRGVKLSLDLMHFGLPDAFHDPKTPEKSDLLNPAWPAHFAKTAVEAVKRYPQLEAITLINEPFVTNNFSGSHWNEAVPGDRAFIDRALLMGEAAVRARTAIEELGEETGARKLFLHNDSCEYRSDDPAFNEFKRFLTSDLILGADWLLAPDFRSAPISRWLVSKFGDEKALFSRLSAIRDAHLEFARKFGKSMKADTVFGMDYYVTCESGPGITHAPETYKSEAQRTRRGLYEMGMDYFARYRLPLMHAETNMREEKSVEWMTQQLIELAALMKSGVPVLGATWYSLMDQAGWENGLSSPVLHNVEEAVAAGRLNPIGLVRLEDGQPRRVAGMLQSLGRELSDVSEENAHRSQIGRGSRSRRTAVAP